MSKLLLIVVFGMMSFPLFAQKIVLSEKEELNFRNDDFMVIGKYQQYTTVYVNHASSAQLIFYNQLMIKEKVSTLLFLPNSIDKIFFAHESNKLHAFYVVTENKNAVVYVSTLKEDYTWTEPHVIESSSSGSYRYSQNYIFCTSSDHTKTLMYHSFFEKGILTLQAKVFDIELHEITSFIQSFPDQNIDITEEAIVNNMGEVFVIANEGRSSKGGSDHIYLINAKKGASTATLFPIDLKNYAVLDYHLLADDEHKILYLFAYFSDSKYSSPRGIYYSVFNYELNSWTASFFTPLTLQISSSRADLRDLKIRDVFLKKTGGLEIVAEKTYQNTRSIGNITPTLSTSYMNSFSENVRTVQEFSYDEIVVFNLNTDGAMAWNQSILKAQTTMDDNGIYSSFGVLRHRLGNAYIFNDMSSKKNRLLSTYLSGNGELTVKELQTSEDIDDWNLMPRSADQISKSEIVMPCVSKSYLCFLKISF